MAITIGVLQQVSGQSNVVAASVLLNSDQILANPIATLVQPVYFNQIYQQLQINSNHYQIGQLSLGQVPVPFEGLYSYQFAIRFVLIGTPVTTQQYVGPVGPPGIAGRGGVAGAVGPGGPPGPTGPAGPLGPTGPFGGPPGPVGPQGVTGPFGATGIRGAPGPTGARGIDGVTGPLGPQGNSGLPGEVGPQGNAGPVGPQGVTGPTGPFGPTGPAGTSFTNTLVATHFFQNSGSVSITSSPISVVSGGITFTTGFGEKLVISGQCTLGPNGTGSDQSLTLQIYVDGGLVASSSCLVTHGGGSDLHPCSVLFETSVLLAGSHNVDLQVATGASSQAAGPAQLQILRVTV